MSRCLALALVLALAPAAAHAGGVVRPNAGSPRSVAMGGAWAAIADDAYCLHANPAGCAFAPLGALTAVELVVAPRTYVPPPDARATGPQDATAMSPAPVLGILFKPAGRDSRFTVGIGAWNTFGGRLSWARVEPDDPLDTTPISQITDIASLVFELAVGVGWQVNDRIAFGGGIRVGVGIFGVTAIRRPTDSDLSATGVGVGATLGVMLRPTDRITVGAGWRSDMDVKTSGTGELVIMGNPTDLPIEHVQTWPQSLSASVAFHASDALTLAGQIDWTQWSSYESLDITFPSRPSQNPQGHYELDWDDSLTFRIGAQYQASRTVVLRAGALYDQNAIPDRTIERQYLDSNKFGGSLGTSIRLSGRLALDVAANVIAGPARTVPDNSAEVPDDWQKNVGPGEYSGQIFTLGTALRIAL